MSHNLRHVVVNSDDTIQIIHCSAEDGSAKHERQLHKTLFELSRTTDLTTHFDPAVHTREAIAAGISGHRALALTAECEDTDLPLDRYFRNAWEWGD